MNTNKRNREAFKSWMINKKIGRPKQQWNDETQKWEKVLV